MFQHESELLIGRVPPGSTKSSLATGRVIREAFALIVSSYARMFAWLYSQAIPLLNSTLQINGSDAVSSTELLLLQLVSLSKLQRDLF